MKEKSKQNNFFNLQENNWENHYFDMPESDDVIKPDTIPETIIHPVNTSRIKRLVF